MGPQRGEIEQVGLLNEAQERFLNDQFQNNVDQSPLYKSGQSYLQGILAGGPNATAEFSAPYMHQFNQQIAPGLAQRFAGMGTGNGALGSSAFNQTMATAGSGLQATLAALRQQLMGQSANQALAYAQQPFANKYQGLQTRAFENIARPDQPGFLGALLPGLLQGGAMALGGGLMGGLMNGGLGSAGMGGIGAMGMDGMNVMGASRPVGMGFPGM